MSISHKSYEPVGSTRLRDSFFQAHGLDEGEGIYLDTESDTDAGQDTDTVFGEQSTYDYCPEVRMAMLRKLSNIEDLINSYDFIGAAEEILKLNIANIPQNLFERYSNALDITAENLSLRHTYLNAQLASQSLVVFAIQDELQQNGVLFALDEAGNSGAMEDLGLQALDNLAAMIWNFGFDDTGIADEHNPQLNPNTAVLARFMSQQTQSDHMSASLQNDSRLAEHVYNLEMRLGG